MNVNKRDLPIVDLKYTIDNDPYFFSKLKKPYIKLEKKINKSN